MRISEAVRPQVDAAAKGHHRSSGAGLPGRLSLVFLAVITVSLLLIFSHLSHYQTLFREAEKVPVAAQPLPDPLAKRQKEIRAVWRKLRSLSTEEQGQDRHNLCISWGATGYCMANATVLTECAKSCMFFVYCEMCKAQMIEVATKCAPCTFAHARHNECIDDASADGLRFLSGALPPSVVDRRLELPTASQVVLELGGNLGDDLAGFVRSLGPATKIFTSEPVPDFYTKLEEKYTDEPRVTILRYGVADKDTNMTFKIGGLGGQASGGLNEGSEAGDGGKQAKRVPVFLRDADAMFEEIQDAAGQPPDSMSVNCEGCEYLVLRRLQERGWLPRIAYLQLSWHVVDAIQERVSRRCEIERALRETHDLIWYDGFYGWQGWQRRAAAVI